MKDDSKVILDEIHSGNIHDEVNVIGALNLDEDEKQVQEKETPSEEE